MKKYDSIEFTITRMTEEDILTLSVAEDSNYKPLNFDEFLF